MLRWRVIGAWRRGRRCCHSGSGAGRVGRLRFVGLLLLELLLECACMAVRRESNVRAEHASGAGLI